MERRIPEKAVPGHKVIHVAAMPKTLTFRLGIVTAFIMIISCAHYFTNLHLHRLHAVYDRLYYLPIFMAALWFGLKGGLAASVGSSLLYAPHILFQWKLMPAMAPERFLEIALFNIVGGLTGILAERANQQRELYQRTSAELEKAYQEIRERSSVLLLLEQRLRKAEKHFALGELSATVSHEFMNPLGSIKGAAEILRDEFPPSHEKHAFLEILIKETERLERTARNILRFGTQLPLSKVPCNPNALIETLLYLTRDETVRHKVKIQTELSSSVRTLPLDEDKIHQALLNLVTNAIQAMPTGGTISIGSEWKRQSPSWAGGEDAREGLLLTVSDTGVGIGEQEINRVFDPFYTTRADGTGLGLAIVKRIIKAHGGIVTVQSRKGQGTIFSIWLPSGETDSGPA